VSVTSHRRPQRYGKAASVLGVTTAAVATVTLVPNVGHASPQPTLDQVKAQIAADQQRAEYEGQQYDKASEQLTQLHKQISELQNQVAEEQAALNKLESALGSVAAAQYRAGGVDETLQLMLANHPDSYLQQSAMMNEVQTQQAASMTEIQHAQQQLRQDRQLASTDIAEAEQVQTSLGVARQASQQALAAAQYELNQVDATMKAEIEKALNGDGTWLPPGTLPPVTGRVATAIAFAQAQLGKGYILGATGPDFWDCSGLVRAAYAAAGVSLPRTTWEQINVGTPVTPDLQHLQPGDIIFYYAGNTHEALYVGNGIILQAANPEAGVDYAAYNSMPIYGAVNPLG
jgi:cell wall-associated NlpC family hydrolase